MQGVWSKTILAGALRRQTAGFPENTLRGERYDLRNAPLEQSRLHAPYVINPGYTARGPNCDIPVVAVLARARAGTTRKT